MSERVPDPPSPYAGYVSYIDYSRLAARVAELEAEAQRRSNQWVEAIGTLRAIGDAVGCSGDELAALAAVRKMDAERAKLRICVKAVDQIRGSVTDEFGGASDWCVYDAARAEVDNG